jgi:membrane protein required for colicin V production
VEWLAFNWLDYCIIAVVGLSIIISLVRGFVRESLSLTTWVLAVWLAVKFHPTLAPMLVSMIQSEMIRSVAAFLAIFFVVLVVGTILSYAIARLVHKTGLSGTDRLLGSLFGFARGVFLIALLLLVVELFDEPQPEEQQWLEASRLAGYFTPLTDWLVQRVPQSLEDSRLMEPPSADEQDLDVQQAVYTINIQES